MCGTCLDARGLTESDVMAGTNRSTMDGLAQTTLTANQVLVL